MNRHRQKIMIAVLVVIAAWFGYDTVRSTVMGPFESRQRDIAKYRKEITKRRADLKRAKRLAAGVGDFERGSLPSDPQAARAAYQDWLLKLVRRAGLTGPTVDSTQPGNFRGVCRSIQFSLQARGDLRQWTKFLYEFYGSGQLHQIRSLVFSPGANREVIDLSVSIEALILPNVDRTDRLSDEQAERLAFATLADYGVIARRNLFSVGGNVDPVEQTFLTGVNRINGEPEAWFTLRAEKDPNRAVVKLRRGDRFEFGELQGTIVEIWDDDVVLDLGGERWLLAIGENLSQASALPPRR